MLARGFRACALVGAVTLALTVPRLAAAVGGTTEVVVKPGDTLDALSSAYGVSVGQIAALNGLANPDVIRAGQVLELAGALGSNARSKAGDVITVKNGDTLWTLAHAHGVGVTELARANNLPDPNVLAIGQRLAIPARRSPENVFSVSALPDSPVGKALDAAAIRHGVDSALVRALALGILFAPATAFAQLTPPAGVAEM